MQLCTADVRINGSVQHVVPKEDVTPAEIVVLREIHGQDAVVNIRPVKEAKRSHQEEFERLRTRYGGAGAMSADQKPGVVLERLFPGITKSLPLRLADIGMGHVDRPEQETEHASEETSPAAATEGESGSGEAPSLPSAASLSGFAPSKADA